ncbi:MAG: potassium channel family protein [Acidimicrobiales bacterium]
MVKLAAVRRRRRNAPIGDLYRRLALALTILVAVLAVGTIGYLILGLSLIDAIYQTVITVSTVGFREVGAVDNQYKAFTILLVMFGAGSVLYTIGVLLETLVEGRLSAEVGRRRMERDIEELEGHIVVCGWGQVGQAISATLEEEGKDIVVVDRREDVSLQPHLHLVGDATDDGLLARAGVANAAALVAALDSAADNVYVTLSARALNSSLFIVARATSKGAEPTLYRAGADRVVNPHQLGGAHMAALVTQPNVAEFLDIAMHDRELAVTIIEVTIPHDSSLVDRPLAEAELGGATVLALRERTGRFVHHPDLSMRPKEGDVLIALGTESDHSNLRRAVGH